MLFLTHPSEASMIVPTLRLSMAPMIHANVLNLIHNALTGSSARLGSQPLVNKVLLCHKIFTEAIYSILHFSLFFIN